MAYTWIAELIKGPGKSPFKGPLYFANKGRLGTQFSKSLLNGTTNQLKGLNNNKIVELTQIRAKTNIYKEMPIPSLDLT